MKNSLRTSIGTKAVENIYQSEPNVMNSEKLHSYNHRKSNSSITSGIYEEIRDDVCSSELKTSLTGKLSCNLQMEPPALPPRQKWRPESTEEDRYDYNFV